MTTTTPVTIPAEPTLLALLRNPASGFTRRDVEASLGYSYLRYDHRSSRIVVDLRSNGVVSLASRIPGRGPLWQVEFDESRTPTKVIQAAILAAIETPEG